MVKHTINEKTLTNRLISAIRNQEEGEIQRILKTKWDVNTKVRGMLFESVGFNTALLSASFRCRPDIVKILLDKGANPNLYHKNGAHPIANSYDGLMPNDVHKAKKITDLLIKFGGNLTDLSGKKSPLAFLSLSYVNFNTEEEKKMALDLTQFLFDKNADHHGSEIIGNAALFDQPLILKFLIEDVKINIVEKYDQEALIHASQNSSYGSAFYLKQTKLFDVNLKNQDGKTAMDYAVENRDDRMINILSKLQNK